MSEGPKDPMRWLERQAYTAGKTPTGKIFLHVALEDGTKTYLEGESLEELARVAKEALALRRVP